MWQCIPFNLFTWLKCFVSFTSNILALGNCLASVKRTCKFIDVIDLCVI